MNLDQFSTVVEDRRYINPQVALDESNAFIQKMRDNQQADTAQIARDTYNLGTAVPSNVGGLSGSGSYFNARYQTPQTNSMVADLKATAQAQALNDAINNTIAQAKERYNQAYRNYKKKSRRYSLGGGYGGNGGGTTPTDPSDTTKGDVDFEELSQTEDTFWKGYSDDDKAHYGLYELKRPEGISDDEWEEMRNKWMYQMGFKYRAQQGLPMPEVVKK